MKVEKIQRHTLKVLSALLAVSLWFYVLNSEPVEIEKKLSVNYILPKGLVMLSLSEKEITLKLKGSKAFVSNIFTKSEKLTVDLNPYYQSYGKNFKVKFYGSALNIPFGVDILDIEPKETNVELDQLGMMEVAIKVHVYGEIPKERKLKEFHVNPKTMMISGPLEILKTMSKIETAPVNLVLLNKDDGSLNLLLAPLDPRLKFDDDIKLKLFYKTRKLY